MPSGIPFCGMKIAFDKEKQRRTSSSNESIELGQHDKLIPKCETNRISESKREEMIKRGKSQNVKHGKKTNNDNNNIIKKTSTAAKHHNKPKWITIPKENYICLNAFIAQLK